MRGIVPCSFIDLAEYKAQPKGASRRVSNVVRGGGRKAAGDRPRADKGPRASYRGTEFSLDVARTLLSRDKARAPSGVSAHQSRPFSTAGISAGSRRRGLLEFPSVPLMSISNVNQSKNSEGGHLEVWTEDLRCLSVDLRYACTRAWASVSPLS